MLAKDVLLANCGKAWQYHEKEKKIGQDYFRFVQGETAHDLKLSSHLSFMVVLRIITDHRMIITVPGSRSSWTLVVDHDRSPLDRSTYPPCRDCGNSPAMGRVWPGALGVRSRRRKSKNKTKPIAG